MHISLAYSFSVKSVGCIRGITILYPCGRNFFIATVGADLPVVRIAVVQVGLEMLDNASLGDIVVLHKNETSQTLKALL